MSTGQLKVHLASLWSGLGYDLKTLSLEFGNDIFISFEIFPFSFLCDFVKTKKQIRVMFLVIFVFFAFLRIFPLCHNFLTN